MRRSGLLAVVIGLALGAQAQAATYGFDEQSECKDPTKVAERLMHTVVSLSVPLKEEEREYLYLDTLGATAWFLDKGKTLVTIQHVAVDAYFSAETYRKVILEWNDAIGGEMRRFETEARVSNVYPGEPGVEMLVALELKDPVPGAVAATIRASAVLQHEPLIALAYPNGKFLIATGRVTFPKPSDQPPDEHRKPPPRYLPLEMADGNNRIALGEGASGSPTFDCKGALVATNVALVGYAFDFGSFGTTFMTYSWGNANIDAVATLPLSRKEVRDAINLVLPAQPEEVATGESRDEELTRLLGEVAEGARDFTEGSGNSANLVKAWSALTKFSRGEQGGGKSKRLPLSLEPPAFRSPFE